MKRLGLGFMVVAMALTGCDAIRREHAVEASLYCASGTMTLKPPTATVPKEILALCEKSVASPRAETERHFYRSRDGSAWIEHNPWGPNNR